MEIDQACVGREKMATEEEIERIAVVAASRSPFFLHTATQSRAKLLMGAIEARRALDLIQSLKPVNMMLRLGLGALVCWVGEKISFSRNSRLHLRYALALATSRHSLSSL